MQGRKSRGIGPNGPIALRRGNPYFLIIWGFCSYAYHKSRFATKNRRLDEAVVKAKALATDQKIVGSITV